MSTAKITAKGQVTIPKEVRNALDLALGDQVVFSVEGERAVLYPVRRRGLANLRGVAAGRAPFPGRDAEREAAMEAAARHATKRSGE